MESVFGSAWKTDRRTRSDWSCEKGLRLLSHWCSAVPAPQLTSIFTSSQAGMAGSCCWLSSRAGTTSGYCWRVLLLNTADGYWPFYTVNGIHSCATVYDCESCGWPRLSHGTVLLWLALYHVITVTNHRDHNSTQWPWMKAIVYNWHVIAVIGHGDRTVPGTLGCTRSVQVGIHPG